MLGFILPNQWVYVWIVICWIASCNIDWAWCHWGLQSKYHMAEKWLQNRLRLRQRMRVHVCMCAEVCIPSWSTLSAVTDHRPEESASSLIYFSSLLIFPLSPFSFPLHRLESLSFSAHININRALNSGIPTTNCPLWSSRCRSLPIPPSNDTGEIEGPHTELGLTEDWFIPFKRPHPHLHLFTAPLPSRPPFLCLIFVAHNPFIGQESKWRVKESGVSLLGNGSNQTVFIVLDK